MRLGYAERADRGTLFAHLLHYRSAKWLVSTSLEMQVVVGGAPGEAAASVADQLKSVVEAQQRSSGVGLTDQYPEPGKIPRGSGDNGHSIPVLMHDLYLLSHHVGDTQWAGVVPMPVRMRSVSH